MALENAKRFLSMVQEDEALLDRMANLGRDEVQAAAKEMGLEFTAEELKEAADTFELTPEEMASVAGGYGKKKRHPKTQDPCPSNNGRGHNWVKTGHYEDEWFGWLKDGGLWTLGYDTYKCSYCGRTKDVHV